MFYLFYFWGKWDIVKYIKWKIFYVIILYKGFEFFFEWVMGVIVKNVIVVFFRYLNCYYWFYLSKLGGKCLLFYLKKYRN